MGVGKCYGLILVGCFHAGGCGRKVTTIPMKLTPSHLYLGTVLSWGPRGGDLNLELLLLKCRGV